MNRILVTILGVGVIGMFTACGGVSELTRERVARSETSVQQAQQTLGNSEEGALDMQRARENIEAARRELEEGNAEAAERFAVRAQLYADLAVAKSESAEARRAADELQASLRTLREEANRQEGTN